MNHLGPATVIFLGMHLRLRTAISPLSGPEFSYHHITQAEKTPSHEQNIYHLLSASTQLR